MARPVVLTKTLAAADVDIIAVAQALAAAGNLVLVTAPVTLDSQRRISILSSADDSLLTWTVVGTNEAGSAISETVAGGNAVAVVTLQDFLTVSRVSANGAVAGTVQVGTNDDGSTPWQVPNAHIDPFELAVSFELVSGAVTGTLECTDDTPLAPMYIYQPGYSQTLPVPTPFGWPMMVGILADTQGVVNRPIAAWRWTTTAGAGVCRITARQSGIRN
jgi:hypothetical protein